jgi:hypothetical protein
MLGRYTSPKGLSSEIVHWTNSNLELNHPGGQPGPRRCLKRAGFCEHDSLPRESQIRRGASDFVQWSILNVCRRALCHSDAIAAGTGALRRPRA